MLKKELDESVSFWKARSGQTLPPMCVQAQRSGETGGSAVGVRFGLWWQEPLIGGGCA